MISNSIPVPLPPLLSLFALTSDTQSSLQVSSGKERSCTEFGGCQDLLFLTSHGNVSCGERVPSWQALFWTGIPPTPSVMPCGLVVAFGLECKVSSWDTSPEHLITTPGLSTRAVAAFPQSLLRVPVLGSDAGSPAGDCSGFCLHNGEANTADLSCS